MSSSIVAVFRPGSFENLKQKWLKLLDSQTQRLGINPIVSQRDKTRQFFSERINSSHFQSCICILSNKHKVMKVLEVKSIKLSHS